MNDITQLSTLYSNAIARAEKAEEALRWYGEQARLARLIHSEGDKGRHALAADGGKWAREVLSAPPPPVRETP